MIPSEVMRNGGGDNEIRQASDLRYSRAGESDLVDEERIHLCLPQCDDCLLKIKFQVLRDPLEIEPQRGQLRAQAWIVDTCILLLKGGLGKGGLGNPNRIEVESSLA